MVQMQRLPICVGARLEGGKIGAVTFGPTQQKLISDKIPYTGAGQLGELKIIHPDRLGVIMEQNPGLKEGILNNESFKSGTPHLVFEGTKTVGLLPIGELEMLENQSLDEVGVISLIQA